MSIQFTQEKIQELRKKIKNNPEILTRLMAETDEILNHEMIVPKTGIATWNLYYFCPTHSVRLKWDIENPKKHICPIDGEVFLGEPYDGAWWRWMNGLNSKFVYQGALIAMLTDKKEYFQKVKNILLEYSKYYPSYEEHGGIPNNGPGKANAQTLCESIMLREFALGYDLIKEKLTQEEQAQIEKNLFREGAEFLIKHRIEELHNHQVKVSAAIGILGIILGEEKYINFAKDEKYGLRYQLEEGLLKDGLWFEGSLRYHIYSLEAFLLYEKFATNTKYTMLDHSNYKKMLEVIPKFLLPDNSMPKLNDVIYGQHLINLTKGFENINPQGVFEFTYSYFKDEVSKWFLEEIYRNQPRNNMDYFLYGSELTGKKSNSPIPEKYFSEENGYTISTHKGEKYMLFKHNIYGGEHDHFDRLGIMLYGYGKEIVPDLGTTGYGAKLHYDYYKNTASHNTVNVNGQNQPPSKARVLKHYQKENEIFTDAFVNFKEEFERVDSHKLIEWDTDSYKDITMRRIIKSTDDYILDYFLVENPYLQEVDWVIHVDGETEVSADELKEKSLGNTKVYKNLENIRILSDVEEVLWKKEEVELKLWMTSEGETVNFLAEGPNNPNVGSINYLIRRSRNKKEVFATVYELSKKDGALLKNVKFELGETEIKTYIKYKNGKIKEEKVNLKKDILDMNFCKS